MDIIELCSSQRDVLVVLVLFYLVKLRDLVFL